MGFAANNRNVVLELCKLCTRRCTTRSDRTRDKSFESTQHGFSRTKRVRVHVMWTRKGILKNNYVTRQRNSIYFIHTHRYNRKGKFVNEKKVQKQQLTIFDYNVIYRTCIYTCMYFTLSMPLFSGNNVRNNIVIIHFFPTYTFAYLHHGFICSGECRRRSISFK